MSTRQLLESPRSSMQWRLLISIEEAQRYVVELEPLGLPVSGAPSNEASVREAVRGVLRGLSILHKSGKIF